jgi:hypothetical protein
VARDEFAAPTPERAEHGRQDGRRAMPTVEERQQFLAQITEAVRAGLPAPEKVDLKAIEKAAEAGAVRGARLRQEGEEAAKRQSPIAAALAHPAVLVRRDAGHERRQCRPRKGHPNSVQKDGGRLTAGRMISLEAARRATLAAQIPSCRDAVPWGLVTPSCSLQVPPVTPWGLTTPPWG